jgi:lysophospholipase L1-like esterase
VKNQGNRDKEHGTLTTPPEQYERNLEQLVRRLERTGATLVWAQTTVVPENEAGRVVGDDRKYNAIATRVMQRHGIAIDDLYNVSAAFPPLLRLEPGNVHYTTDGYKALAKPVAAAIKAALQQRQAKRR